MLGLSSISLFNFFTFILQLIANSSEWPSYKNAYNSPSCHPIHYNVWNGRLPIQSSAHPCPTVQGQFCNCKHHWNWSKVWSSTKVFSGYFSPKKVTRGHSSRPNVDVYTVHCTALQLRGLRIVKFSCTQQYHALVDHTYCKELVFTYIKFNSIPARVDSRWHGIESLEQYKQTCWYSRRMACSTNRLIDITYKCQLLNNTIACDTFYHQI